MDLLWVEVLLVLQALMVLEKKGEIFLVGT